MTNLHFSFKSGLIGQIKPLCKFSVFFQSSLNYFFNTLNHFIHIKYTKKQVSLNHFFESP